ARREMKSIQQLTGNVVGRRHSQRQQGQLGGKNPAAKSIFNLLLQEHSGEDPEDAASTVGDQEHDQRKEKTSGTAEGNIKNPADEESHPNRSLHATWCITSYPAGCNWPNGSADPTRSEQHTNASRRVSAHRKNLFSKHREQGEDAPTQA